MLIGNHPLAWVARAAIAFATVGVFGTWRASGPVSLNGIEGPHNGWLVIIFGSIALAGVRSLSHGSWLGIVTVLGAAAVMISVAVEDVVNDESAIGGRSGWGVWLTFAASGVLAGVAVLAAVRRVRPNAAEAGQISEPAGGD
jgi:hypothetical protein